MVINACNSNTQKAEGVEFKVIFRYSWEANLKFQTVSPSANGFSEPRYLKLFMSFLSSLKKNAYLLIQSHDSVTLSTFETFLFHSICSPLEEKILPSYPVIVKFHFLCIKQKHMLKLIILLELSPK